MKMRHLVVVATVFTVLGVCTPAAAQIPLAQVIPTMLGPDMLIAPGPGGNHGREFARDLGEFEFIDGVVFIDGFQPPRGSVFVDAILDQVTTFPTGSSSGGFLFGFDKALGTFTRTTRSFGPTFAERTLTGGKKTLAVGFSFQVVDYDRIDGTLLDGGDMRFHYRHRDLSQDCRPSPTNCLTLQPTAERSDVIEATLRVRYRTQMALTTLTYGVTDRLDVGATIPFLENTLEATVDQRILRYGTASNPLVHSFDGQGSDRATATGGGTASGPGDIRLQAKYNFVRRPSWGVSGLWDVRFPTGDAEKLTGTGTVFTRWLGVFSAGNRTFSAHANGGITFSSDPYEETTFMPSFEYNYTAGFDWSVIQRVTVSSDVMVRHSPRGRPLMGVADRSLPVVGGSVVVQEFQSLWVNGETLRVAQGAVGGKIAVWRTMLVTGNVLFGMRSEGLMHKPALNFGLEYTF
jgi:hypothetical protein